MVLAFTIWTVMAAMYDKTNGEAGFGIAQIVFVWVFGIFYDIGFSGLLVAYTLEVLPFHLRAKGIMIMNITVQATLALGGQTNPLAWHNLPAHWNFCLFYTVCSPYLLNFGTLQAFVLTRYIALGLRRARLDLLRLR